MSYGPISVFPATMASAGTLTGQIDLGRAWKNIYLEIPTLTSNTQIHIQAAASSGGTFRRVGYLDQKVIPLVTPTIASGATLSSEFDLGEGISNVYVQVPTFATSTQTWLQVAGTTGGTFKRATIEPANSGVAQTNDFIIQSGVSGRMTPLPAGIRYFKIELGSGVTDVAHSFAIFGTKLNVVDFSVASSVTNRIAPIPAGFRYVKVETTATVDDGATFRIYGSE